MLAGNDGYYLFASSVAESVIAEVSPVTRNQALLTLLATTNQQASDLPSASIDHQPGIDLTKLPSLNSFDHA